jgi:hypothetical protein
MTNNKFKNIKTFWTTGENFCGIIAQKFTFETKSVNIFVKYIFIAVIGHYVRCVITNLYSE